MKPSLPENEEQRAPVELIGARARDLGPVQVDHVLRVHDDAGRSGEEGAAVGGGELRVRRWPEG